MKVVLHDRLLLVTRKASVGMYLAYDLMATAVYQKFLMK